MPDEKFDALDFTAEERAEADTSFVDPDQWNDRDEAAAAAEEGGATKAKAPKPEPKTA